MARLLITGAGGFIGSHLVEACVERGYDVRAFVHYNSRNRWGWLESSPVKGDIEFIAGDVRDYDAVFAAMAGVDWVFHLAALIGIPYSYRSPLAYVRTNIEGTYNVLQAAREHEIEQVVVTSTSETYGTAQYVPIDEKHPAVGQSPYAATKIGADQLALSFHRSFGLPVKVARPFNTYGPRQSARAIISSVISQVLSGCERVRVGNLEPTRDLTYVKDTVAGFLAIADSDVLTGEATNIGMGQEISIGHLIALISDVCGREVETVVETKRIRPANSEVERLCCDNTKLRTHTHWTPQYDLRRGLEETVRWFEQNLTGYKADVYNI